MSLKMLFMIPAVCFLGPHTEFQHLDPYICHQVPWTVIWFLGPAIWFLGPVI
jgi:hypothetical protein